MYIYNVDLEIFVLQTFRVLYSFSLKYICGLGHTRKYFDGIKLILRSQVWWSERDYAHGLMITKFAAFMATTQLLANYSHVKENRRML